MRTEIDSIRIFERSIPKKHSGAYLGPRSFLLRLYVEPYEESRLEYSVDAGFFPLWIPGFLWVAEPLIHPSSEPPGEVSNRRPVPQASHPSGVILPSSLHFL